MSVPAALDGKVRRNPRRLLRLWFGAIAAPVVWLAQLLLNYATTALACFPAEVPQNAPLYSWSHALTIAVDVIAILVAIAAVIVSYGNWQMQGRHWPKRARAGRGGRTLAFPVGLGTAVQRRISGRRHFRNHRERRCAPVQIGSRRGRDVE